MALDLALVTSLHQAGSSGWVMTKEMEPLCF